MFTPRSSIAAVIIVTCGLGAVLAAQGPPKVWTQQHMLARNVGTREDQRSPFPPHRIVGNVYYVGTRSLSSFLVTTPQGHVLINTTFEANVPAIKASVESLGFAFADIEVSLGSHAHGDHMEGDALAKELAAGARVMAMAEDVPALEGMQPGGKPHPIDRVLRDGDQVALGGTGANPFIDPAGYRTELDIVEGVFRSVLAEQRRAGAC